LRLLDEPVKDQNAALLHAKQDASDPVARQRRALAKFEKRRSLSSYPFVEHVGQPHQFRTRHDLAKTHERDRAQTKMQQNQ